MRMILPPAGWYQHDSSPPDGSRDVEQPSNARESSAEGSDDQTIALPNETGSVEHVEIHVHLMTFNRMPPSQQLTSGSTENRAKS